MTSTAGVVGAEVETGRLRAIGLVDAVLDLAVVFSLVVVTTPRTPRQAYPERSCCTESSPVRTLRRCIGPAFSHQTLPLSHACGTAAAVGSRGGCCITHWPWESTTQRTDDGRFEWDDVPRSSDFGRPSPTAPVWRGFMQQRPCGATQLLCGWPGAGRRPIGGHPGRLAAGCRPPVREPRSRSSRGRAGPAR